MGKEIFSIIQDIIKGSGLTHIHAGGEKVDIDLVLEEMRNRNIELLETIEYSLTMAKGLGPANLKLEIGLAARMVIL